MKLPLLSFLMFWGIRLIQPIYAQTNVSGTISINTTWTTAGSPYILTGGVIVDAAKTLTINPGVAVQFEANSNLTVKGTLKATGTKALPINFSPVGYSGSYHGPLIIEVSSINTVLQHVNISNFYVPDAAVIIKSANSCKIDSCVISGTAGSGIDIQGSSPATISRNILSGNRDYDVILGLDDLNKLSANNKPLSLGLTSQTMTVDAVLTPNNNYSLVNPVVVEPAKTLTINPGVAVRFGVNCNLTVKGTLKATGTKALPINFSPVGYSGSYHGPLIIEVSSTNTVLQHVNISNFYVPDAAVIIKSANSCKIDSCVISGTAGSGIDIQGSSPATISRNILSGNRDYDVILGLDDLNKLSANNKPLSLGLTSQTMTVDAVLTPNNNYSLVNPVVVEPAKTLTINPGVAVRFGVNCNLTVKGTLKATGTKALPINFSPVGYSGSYHGPLIIEVSSTNTVLQHVNISNFYVPDAAVIIKSANSCKIDSCVISGTAGSGIDLLTTSSIISNNQFSGNTNGDITGSALSFKNLSGNTNAIINIIASTINQDAFLSNPGSSSSYLLKGTILVNPSNNLTIAAGTKVLFNDNNANIIVQGALTAIGTKANKIIFESAATAFGGTISFDSTSQNSSLIYVSTSKLGSLALPARGTAIELKTGSITIRNSNISNSQQAGLSIIKGSPTILESNFINNKTGVLCSAGKAKFIKCSFTGNSLYGINNTSTVVKDTVDARNCWWGDSTGPHQSSTNARGLGDSVSLKVLYKPYASRPFEPNDIGIASILLPGSSCNLSSAEKIKVRIKNFGIEEQSGFNVSFQVNNADTVTENVGNLKIPTDSTGDYTFARLANLSAPGRSYIIKVFTSLQGDTVQSNDSKISVIKNQKPNVGKDTAVKICKEGFINLWTLYDTTGYKIKTWLKPRPDSAGVGTFTLVVANGNGCADTAVATVTAYVLPTPTISASGNTTFCKGGNVTLTSSYAPKAYLWSNGAVTSDITVTQAGNYFVTTTNDAGCKATSAATLVQVNETVKPVITVIKGALHLCPGTSVTLRASSSPDYYYYAWNTNDTTQSLLVDTAGTYTVTVTGSNGCKNTSDSAVVTEICTPPTALKSTQITDISANLSWNTVNCAAGYSLRYRKTGSGNWTIVTTTNTNYTIKDLTASTSYDWAVASSCQLSPLIQSAYTATLKFTTLAGSSSRPLVKQEVSDKVFSAVIYPVPVINNTATLSIRNSPGKAIIKLCDLYGRVLWILKNAGDGALNLPLEIIAAGTYIINIYSGKENITIKFVKE